jgi:hypothetical protein
MIVLAELPSFHALSTAHCPLFTVHCSTESSNTQLQS